MFKQINSFDKFGLERAALEFAEDRMLFLRKVFDKVTDDAEPANSGFLRRKMMRNQIRSVQSQLRALDALIAIELEEKS